MPKITAKTQDLSSKFFKSKEYFPIDINFGDKERIRISKRPRRTTTEIIDIYANDLHIGMFVGIEKNGNVQFFGPAGINKSHSFRGILNYVFVKLLEYFGLDGLIHVQIDEPEDFEFRNFLLALGFVSKGKKMLFHITEEKIKQFTDVLQSVPNDILPQTGQIETLIKLNNDKVSAEDAMLMTDKIVEKIKNMDPLGAKFWDNRRVAQINTGLNTAIVFQDAGTLIKDEFLELCIKTIVASFETFNREPYLEELMWALEGKKEFSMDYIQKMVVKMQTLMPDEIAAMPKDHLRKWIHENMEGWQLSDKIQEETRKDIIEQSRLTTDNFGSQIKDNLKEMVEAMVDHYNGDNIFYGMENKF